MTDRPSARPTPAQVLVEARREAALLRLRNAALVAQSRQSAADTRALLEALGPVGTLSVR